MLSDTDEAVEISPIPSPVPLEYIPNMNDRTVVTSKPAGTDVKMSTLSNGHASSNFIHMKRGNLKENVTTKSSINSKNSLLKMASVDHSQNQKLMLNAKREESGNRFSDAERKDGLASGSNLHRLLVQPKDTCVTVPQSPCKFDVKTNVIPQQMSSEFGTEKQPVPSISPRDEVSKNTSATNLPVMVNVIHKSPVNQPRKVKNMVLEANGAPVVLSSNSTDPVLIPGNQKPIVMTQMLIPSSSPDAKVAVNAAPQISQMAVRNIPGHITVLRAGGTTFTLPAQMLPAGALHLNSNNGANIFSPTQPALQLVSQPQNNTVKLVQGTTASDGIVFPQAITIVKPPILNKTSPVAAAALGGAKLTSRPSSSSASKHFPMSIKIPCSLANEAKAGSSVAVVPLCSPSKVNADQLNRTVMAKPASMAKTSQVTSPLVTTPPFTFTKFSIKQVGSSATSATVNKSAANMSNQPQVSVMTMNSHPPGKAFTQILHQTLLQGIPSCASSTLSGMT